MKAGSFSIIFLASLFFSCKKQPQQINDKKLIAINLNSSSENNFFIKPISVDKPFFSEKNIHPKFYKKQLQSFKGVPKLDSLALVSQVLQSGPYLYNLYHCGDITKQKYLEKLYGHFQDTALYATAKKYQLNAISGFLDKQQIMIVDANNNGDFSDDITFTFDKNFRNTFKYSPYSYKTDSIPSINITYTIISYGKTYNVNRKMAIYPSAKTNPYIYYLSNAYSVDENLNNYSLLNRAINYYTASFTVNGKRNNINIQGSNYKSAFIVIKPDSISYDKTDLSFQLNFQYRVKDTAIIQHKTYLIDSLTPDFTKLYLKKLDINEDSIKSYRMGYRIKAPLYFNTLQGVKNTLGRLIKKPNTYTLIDFWGTWCTPCKELIPDIKELHKKYGSQINFISIAFDENPEIVETFTKKHVMNWSHGFVDNSNRGGTIIPQLSVTSFPTFILLDEHNKIIHRGTGDTHLEKIKAIIQKKFKTVSP
ncbi:TlpA family protein disulfide reductase [Zhouia sp. PK063]|uniref:TlpA family protein disulfide reductase n=1 Tax=Zhouia sp. PK063 TaxID=3373602 RepID=UPI0037A09261